MALFDWTESHLLNISDIDAEHQQVFERASQLCRFLQRGAPLAECSPLLEALVEVTEGHFQHEEELMREAKCASASWHALQHTVLLKKLKELPECEDAKAALEFLRYLAQWFEDHMRLSDRMMVTQMRSYYRMKALKRPA